MYFSLSFFASFPFWERIILAKFSAINFPFFPSFVFYGKGNDIDTEVTVSISIYSSYHLHYASTKLCTCCWFYEGVSLFFKIGWSSEVLVGNYNFLLVAENRHYKNRLNLCPHGKINVRFWYFVYIIGFKCILCEERSFTYQFSLNVSFLSV